MFREKFTDEDEISLNMLRVQKYMNNTRMEELARDNMPFMGLDIHGLQELTLKPVSIKTNNFFYNVKYLICTFQNLPHTVNMIQRGMEIKTIDDLLNMKLDATGGSLSSKSSNDGKDKGKTDTAGEVSSMTSGSFDRSSAEGGKLKGKIDKPQAKKAPVKSEATKAGGLPMISEKSASPSELSGS